MEYQHLTDDHRRAMWQQALFKLEETHHALTIERALAVRVGNTDQVAAVDARLATIEEQHAEALAQLTEKE